MRGPDLAWRAPACAAALLLAALPLHSHATLGEPEAAVHAQAQRWGSQVSRQAPRQAASVGAAAVQVITLSQPDGSTIRQYLNPNGLVFAVAWNTRYKPRLDELLGGHHGTYAQAARQARQAAPGARHQAHLRSGDLAVTSQTHLQSHVGRAWLQSLTPAKFNTDVIR